MAINLEEFIAQSLTQIVKGVERAQKEVAGTGAAISPLMRSTAMSNTVGVAEWREGQPCYNVEFDVAVTATESTGTSGGMGLVVGPVALGSKGQSTDALANTSRIKFNVPVVLPLCRPPKEMVS